MKNLYGDEINEFQLEAQLQLLAPTSKSMGFDVDEFNVHKLTNLLQQLEASRKVMLVEVRHLGKLLLVMPATNAVSERSFFGFKENLDVATCSLPRRTTG